MKSLHTGAITFLTGIAAGALAYASRENAEAVAWFVLAISIIGLILAAMRDDK